MKLFVRMFALAAGPLLIAFMFAESAHAQTVRACSIERPPANCNSLWALTVDLSVPNGAYVHVPNPGCINDQRGQIEKMLQAATVAVAAGTVPALVVFSGPISSLVAGPVDEHMRNQGGDLGRLLSPYAIDGAMCATVAGIIPKQAAYVGYRLLATDGHNGGTFSECIPSRDCGIGWSKFPNEPIADKNGSVQTVSAMYMNWSHDRGRTARMIVFYSVPEGVEIATRM